MLLQVYFSGQPKSLNFVGYNIAGVYLVFMQGSYVVTLYCLFNSLDSLLVSCIICVWLNFKIPEFKFIAMHKHPPLVFDEDPVMMFSCLYLVLKTNKLYMFFNPKKGESNLPKSSNNFLCV